MVYKKSFRARYPPAPALHRLFGEKYVKSHLIMGHDNWTPHALANQYKCMADLISKYNELKKLQLSIKQRKQRTKIRKLQQNIFENREELSKESNIINNQTLQHLLKDNKDILRLFNNLSINDANELVTQKIFTKRKESDRERYELQKLLDEYENKLRKYSELEDRLKFKTEYRMPEDDKIDKIRVELVNIKTRIKAIKVIKRCYTDMTDFLMQDAVYYKCVLDALQKDIDEQDNLINHVIHLGLPEIAKLPKLKAEYKKMEIVRKHKIKDRIMKLKNYRNKMVAERDEALKQLHQEVIVEPDPLLYVRETKSILDLKTELSDIEKVITSLKNSTRTITITDMIEVMKTQYENNTKIKSIIDLFEDEQKLLEERELISRKIQENLNYNYTEEEIERIQTIQNFREKISKEKEKQSEIDNYIKEKGEIYTLLGSALEHINDTLRHVGEKIPHPEEREYPNEELKLPLLRFELFIQKSIPPLPTETNLEKLMEVAKRKMLVLMKIYSQLPKDEIEHLKGNFNHKFKHNFNPKVLMQKITEQKEVSDDEDDDSFDIDVTTREQVKSQSTKIVDEHFKREE